MKIIPPAPSDDEEEEMKIIPPAPSNDEEEEIKVVLPAPSDDEEEKKPKKLGKINVGALQKAYGYQQPEEAEGKKLTASTTEKNKRKKRRK